MIVSDGNTATQIKPADKQGLQLFQQRLTDRIKNAQTSATPEQLCLHVKVAGRSMFFLLPETSQVLELSKVAPIPLTHPWLLGLTNIRGELTSVVDLSAWLGWGSTQVTSASRWVTLSASLGVQCLLLVDSVMGLVNIQAGEWRLTDLSADNADAVFPGYADSRKKYTSAVLCDVYQHAQGMGACMVSLAALTQNSYFLDPQRRQVSL